MPTVTLYNNKIFNCATNQTILEAAHAQGIVLEYSCRTGRCGACKAKVLSGKVAQLRPDEILSPAERSSGVILTCTSTANEHISLDVEDIGAVESIKPKTLPCRIDCLSPLADDVIEVTLRTPPSSPLTYMPGQYIDIIGTGGLRRSYSIANAPREDGKLNLQIRRVPNGEMSRYWFDEARVNDLLRLEGPHGTFWLRSTQASQLVLLATGTGIAPIRAMLEQIAINPDANNYQKIHLYWGGRTERDIYWQPHFPELPLRFVPVLTQSSASNFLKRYVQDAALSDGVISKDSIVYACGSEAMTTSARRQLIEEGLPPKHFHSDAFVCSK